MSSRSLDKSEATKLLTQAQAAEIDAKSKTPDKWPGSYNARLIAEAVSQRRQFVDLEPNGKRFSIKYDDKAKAAFIKPADRERNGFAPCGWFTYHSLKEVLVDDE